MENNMSLEFDAKSQNEGLARMVVSAFLTELDPTVEEMNDVKTAVSEAVTNSIIHGYGEKEGQVFMKCSLRTIWKIVYYKLRLKMREWELKI